MARLLVSGQGADFAFVVAGERIMVGLGLLIYQCTCIFQDWDCSVSQTDPKFSLPALLCCLDIIASRIHLTLHKPLLLTSV